MYFKNQYGRLNTEFYTKKEDVIKMIPFLDKSEKYIEPFNKNGNSQIFEVLKEKGFDIKSLNKDFDDKDNYEGRVIITNPPFISRARLFSRLSKKSEKMFLIMSKFSFNCYTKYRLKDKCRRWCDTWKKEKLFDVSSFNTPNGIKKVECVFTKFEKGLIYGR